MKVKMDRMLKKAERFEEKENQFDMPLVAEAASIWNEIKAALDIDTTANRQTFLKELYEKAESLNLYGKICIQLTVVFELMEAEYTNRFLEFVMQDDNLSIESSYFLRWQILSYFFPRVGGRDERSSFLLEKWYQRTVDRVVLEWFPHLEKIPPEERDKDFVVVFTNQFLSIQHGPTKTVLDRAYTLMKKLHKKVLLINTAEYCAKKGEIPLFEYHLGIYNDKLNHYNEVRYRDVTIDYLQLPDVMLDYKQMRKIVRLIQRKKPYFMLNIGGNSILTDVCSILSPVLAVSTIPSGTVTTESQFQMIGHPLTEKEKKQLYALGKTENHIIEGIFTSTVIEQTVHTSREELHIPEDSFVIVMVGGRLTYEITEDFMRFLMRFAPMGAFFVFAGKMEQYDVFCEKISGLRENSVFLGMVPDIFSVLEHCDLYVNPRRTGGGTSSVEAMCAGVPVVTYNMGDVPTNTGEEFIVRDEEEMAQTIKRYMEDKEFYKQKSEAAKKRAQRMLDTDGAFCDILKEFFRRAGL